MRMEPLSSQWHAYAEMKTVVWCSFGQSGELGVGGGDDSHTFHVVVMVAV